MERKRLRKHLKRIAVTGAAAGTAFTALSLGLAMFVMRGKRQTLDEDMEWQTAHYDTSFYGELEKTNYRIRSYDGYGLRVQLLKNPTPTDRYIIISHGYTGNRMSSIKYVKMYLELGFNCIIYDLRGHGLNKHTFTTYSIREGRDLAELIRDTRKRYKGITQLGLHGESLGAASSAACLKYGPQVDFVVCDCGFADIDNVLRGAAGKFSFSVNIADLGARKLYHYSFKDMRPIDSLEQNRVPMLFIHGAEDTFIRPDNSRRMAARTKGISEVHLIKGAGHAESVLTDPVLYKKYVSDFLERIKH